MDLEATMATMTDEPYVNHVPAMTGGVGADERAPVLRRPLHRQVAEGHRDHAGVADGRRRPGRRRARALLHARHRDAPAAPGIAPTGKHVRLAFCVVVRFDDGKVAHEHIYWDQASLLVQIGAARPGRAPGHRRRAGRERARPPSAPAERADPRPATLVRPCRRARARCGRTPSSRRRARARARPAHPGTSRRARAAVAAELVELPAQVANAGPHVALVRPRRPHAEQHGVHELPRLRQELHHAERADARDDVLLEARLHPRECPRERSGRRRRRRAQ